jgi:hypothetical protein
MVGHLSMDCNKKITNSMLLGFILVKDKGEKVKTELTKTPILAVAKI